MFQSPPGPQAGRYAVRTSASVVPPKVSIPARPAGRALRILASLGHRGQYVFQSPPGPQAGRYFLVVHRWSCRTTWFQSPPGPQAGRYPSGREREVEVLHQVSIPARPRRPGATSGPRRRRRTTTTCFQSPPGPQAGRYHPVDRGLARRAHVSIPARPAGRALLDRALGGLAQALLVSIPARPAGWALPKSPAGSRRECHGVSIPARPAGRALRTERHW